MSQFECVSSEIDLWRENEVQFHSDWVLAAPTLAAQPCRLLRGERQVSELARESSDLWREYVDACLYSECIQVAPPSAA